MAKIRFNIGDTVWVALCGNSKVSVVCPDCMGDGRLLVTMGDKTTHSIECTRCGPGFDRPTGRIFVQEYSAMVSQITITGLEANEDRVHYMGGCYRYDDDNVFVRKEEAVAKANELLIEHEREETERLGRKDKDAHSWAFNATYHRRCISQAEKDLKYHKAKLAVASLKAKKDTPEITEEI